MSILVFLKNAVSLLVSDIHFKVCTECRNSSFVLNETARFKNVTITSLVTIIKALGGMTERFSVFTHHQWIYHIVLDIFWLYLSSSTHHLRDLSNIVSFHEKYSMFAVNCQLINIASKTSISKPHFDL